MPVRKRWIAAGLALGLVVTALVLTPGTSSAALTPTPVQPKPQTVTYLPGGGVLVQEYGTIPQTNSKITWGWISGTIYFNKQETSAIANGWGGASMFTAVCAAAGLAIGGPPGAAILGGACAIQAGLIVYTAQVGFYSNPFKCIKLKYGLDFGLSDVRLYTGGYCHW